MIDKKGRQTPDTYSATKDAHDSYFLAVETKRQRGDRHWPEALRAEALNNGAVEPVPVQINPTAHSKTQANTQANMLANTQRAGRKI